MNQKLRRGTKVIIKMNDSKDKLHRLVGVVKYIGPLEDQKDGNYVGLEIQHPYGKHNGTYNGKQYFKAKPHHGIFLKPSNLLFMNGNPVAPGTSGKTGPAKLSKDLGDMITQQNEKLKKEVEDLANQLKELENLDWKQQIDELKKKVKELDDSNRALKIENQKIKYAVTDKDDGKVQELVEKIQFFKSQKEAIQKQKTDLKKKNQQLNAQLQEYAQNMQMVETLTIKIETLEGKNQKLKQDLEAANAQSRNLKMIGTNKGDQSTDDLNENIKTLNQTIVLLESQLNEAQDKNSTLAASIENQEKKMGELKKLELKIRSKDEQIEQLTQQLEINSQAVSFAEKLTLNMLKKQENLKDTALKLNQYINKVEGLENELSQNKELQDEMNQELFSQEELMENYSKTIEEKNNHIQELNRQIEKYKKRICQLTQSTESMLSSMTGGEESIQHREDEIPRSMVNLDFYQNKYYESMKIVQHTQNKFLKNQIQFSEMRNQVGVYMLNLHEALPESFTGKLYPEVISIITVIKSTSDKLWYAFEASVDYLKFRPEIYSRDNQHLAEWLIILMKQISLLYSALLKLQFSLTTSDSEDQISEILSHTVIRDEVKKIDTFFIDLLNKFSEDNISSSIGFESLPLETLDQISLQLKRGFSVEYDTRMKLCTEGMDLIINTYEIILEFKSTSELGENAQVDNLLQNFLKSVFIYLNQCCLNPYIRYKAEMKDYLKGVDLIKLLYSEIKDEGKLHELSSLYSDEESISLLKDTILNMQFHTKQLLKDLEGIHYPTTLSRIQTILPGKVWQERIRIIKQELLRVKDVIDEKKQLEQTLMESKKKILLLEREVKQKQNTKELYEKRIGELQLKVQQSVSLQNQNKRLNDKLKSENETHNMIEEEIKEQSKKRKMIEEQLKIIKDKYEILQTETMLRKKKTKNIQAIPSQDITNLTIFKNAIKESNNLRQIVSKKKLMELKYSPIYTEEINENPTELNKEKNSLRRKGIQQLAKVSVNDPFAVKGGETRQKILDNLLIQMNNLEREKKNEAQRKAVSVGSLFVNINQAKEVYINQNKAQIIGF